MQNNHRRFYRVAGITIQLDSDAPFTAHTFHSKFNLFETAGPGKDTVRVSHHFSLPDVKGKDLGKEVYRRPPWAVYRNKGWVYLGIAPTSKDKRLRRVAVFSADYNRGRLYHKDDRDFKTGTLGSLTHFSTDQILLAQLLADRQGCYLHACGVNLRGRGLLFVGHSSAGKSTMAKMLKATAEILCDDRIIVRKCGKRFRIYGTWNNGEVPDVSAGSAPLKAVFFLEKSKENRLVRVTDRRKITRLLLGCLIRPLVTVEWWQKTLALVEKLSEGVPFYLLKFDKSGKVADLL